jgi:predicted PhzF superfamily epimerase YddE/YHI9
MLPRQTVARFHTLSGLLKAANRGGLIELDFPATPEEPLDLPRGLAEALGVVPVYVGRSRFDYLVEVDSAATVRDLTPDFALLGSLDIRGTIVTSRSDSPDFDFVSRFFAPAVGVNEDPVTGSAHCCLGPFWSHRLGRKDLMAYQASGRGGMLRVRTTDGRVYLGGNAVTVLRGELVV